MKKWLFRIIWIPVLTLVVLFMVANRQPVAVSLDPFNAEAPALTTPAFWLWVWLMLMLFIGVAVGALGMWLSGHDRRRKVRMERRELKALRKEMAALKADREAGAKAKGASSDEPPLLETVSS